MKQNSNTYASKAKLMLHAILLSVLTILVIATLTVYYTIAYTGTAYTSNNYNNEDDANTERNVKESLSYVFDKYYLEVTPRRYVFVTMWLVIYLWLIVGIIFLWVVLFIEHSRYNRKLNIRIIKVNYLISLIINMSANILWVAVAQYERIIMCFLILLLMSSSLYVTIGTVSKVLRENNNTILVWGVRIILQNGIAVYATWSSVTTLLSLAMLLTYQPSPNSNVPYTTGLLEQSVASNVMLTLLLASILIWFMFENFIFTHYLEYILSVYPVVLFILIGVISNKELTAYNYSVGIILISITCIIMCVRILLVIVNFKNGNRIAYSPYSRLPEDNPIIKYNKKEKVATIGEKTPVISK